MRIYMDGEQDERRTLNRPSATFSGKEKGF